MIDGQVSERGIFRSQKAKEDQSGKWLTFSPITWSKKVPWPGKTLNLFQMLKILLASGVAASACALASPAQADWYVNPELNVGVGLDSGVGSGILEGHLGYDFDNGAYVQMGPAAIFPDTGDKEIELTGKAGISGGPLYGEVSFSTGDEVGLGFKTGAKFSF